MRIALAAFVMSFGINIVANAQQSGFDFTQPLLDADGTPVILPQSDPKAAPKVFTYGMAISQALSVNDRGQSQDAASIVQRGELAIRVATAKNAVLSAEEITLIEAAMTKYSPSSVIVARVREMIDPNSIRSQDKK